MQNEQPIISDKNEREIALDINRSFIVQAPAGSGKTELLTRRFVNLLQNAVEAPEEIIAITFTRKAAAEMRHRVLSLLPDCHPHRLRIMTIDAFCAFLCAQMPLKSKLTQRFNIAEDAEELYEKAIHNLFLHHQEKSLEDFLYYLDNDISRVKELLKDILRNRDQWLPHIFGINAIDALEKGLHIVRDETFNRAYTLMPDLKNLEPESIASLFLTKDGTLRKKLPEKIGEVSEELEECLRDILYLPSTHYSPLQKKFILSLSTCLPLLIAELQLIFSEEGQYDFVEITLRALQSLGDEDQPTDLSLKLDYQIKHLLIDEFQDTSITQWRLLQKLTAEWMPMDKRTIFLVGDPMQSIYRFRKAEVGLFLEVQKHGVGNIPLTPLTLTSNFRSHSILVDWFNKSFSAIFPKISDPSIGAITYSPSLGQRKLENKETVFLHPIDSSEKSEAENILDIIRNYPQEKIAILVRSRAHLKKIIPLLQKSHIAFRAVEIANLSDHPLIEDLFSLTKALLHPADRIAWFSILRAPWCGLTLEDLLKLISRNENKTILDLLFQEDNPRIKHFLNAILWTIEKRGRLSLREWVEKTWLKLNGPSCLSYSQDLKIAESYFDLLDKYQDIPLLQKKLSQLALPIESNPDIRLDIMTIHKAKGLEFDVVILPGLEKSTRAENSKLFLWSERLNLKGKIDLLVAPIRHVSEKSSEIYDHLKYEEDKKEEHELQRLLYVACTRAKKFLHLVFSVNLKTPAKKSFLGQFWPLISEQIDLKNKVEKKEKIITQSLLTRLPVSSLNKLTEIKSEKVHRHHFSFIQSQQRHIGTIVHEALQILSENHHLSETYLKMRLLQLSGTTEGFEIIQTCIKNIQKDKKAKWILKSHREAKSEYALTSIINNEIINIVIDRTFVDENNCRWIVDYKITEEISLDNHRAQLEKYATIFKKVENRPIKLGLYFPRTCDWIEWEI
jgi:ATP-dependent helicase/nuclease subunit A